MRSVIILSLCLRWQPSIRASAVPPDLPEVMELSELLYSLVHRSCLCFRAEERRKSKRWKWILSTLLVKCQGVQPVSGDTEGPLSPANWNPMRCERWWCKEIHNQQDHHAATTRESNFILTSLPLVKDPSLPIMAWDWVSRRASVCSSKSTLNRCYTDRIYAKSRDPR